MRHLMTALALGCAAIAVTSPAAAQDTARPASAPAQAAWIARSNGYTMQFALVDAKFVPERASSAGYEQYDGKTFDISKGSDLAQLAAYKDLKAKFTAALASESDVHVKQDLQILLDSLDQRIEGIELSDKLELDWYDIPSEVFGSIGGLLSDQTVPARRAKAVELLKRYTGTYPGTTAYTQEAKARFVESRADGKIGPYDVEVKEAVEKSAIYTKGIHDLFAKYKITGAETALAAMDKQFADYAAWTTATVLPLSRDNPQLPRELYALRLRRVGIDISPEEAAAQARAGFYDLRQQLDILAPQVAAKFGFKDTSYLGVLAALKKQTIANDKIEAFYRDVNRQIEERIEANGIADLPDVTLQMRLASPAEAAAQPAPHFQPPRLVGNTGEQGVFILTAGNPTAANSSSVEGAAYDDFNFPAAAWTLSAHEARPGHEMQFAALIKQGVSLARLLYAFNSVNVEGWALYAEAETLPYEPVEGQLIATQFRLLRAARAFLDPMLNLGQIDRAEGERVLREDAGFSAPMVKQELDRYTFDSPGQAGAYYYGFRRLTDLRIEAETKLGAKFDRKAFNDFLLAQGIIPLTLIAKAVREEFIPAAMEK